MKRALFAIGCGLALGGPLVAIVQKERLIARGRPVFLELAPVDPRSLMQGDYMALDYRVNRDAAGIPHSQANGLLVLKNDDRGVSSFQRFHAGEGLQPGEYLLRFRERHGRIRLGAESFFFQEGQGALFAKARFGELRVDTSGQAVLVGLRDSALQPISAP